MTRPLDLDRLLAYKVPDARDDYDPRDAIIYALGVGAGLRPDIDESRFLFERYLEVLPTMALVLGTPGFWPMDPQSGLDWLNILHGEQVSVRARGVIFGGDLGAAGGGACPTTSSFDLGGHRAHR